MKKYGMISATVVVVVGATLLLVFNSDNKDKASKSTPLSPTDQAANTVKPTMVKNDGNQKQEELVNEIKRMYQPEWEKVTQRAEKRLSELIVQAQKEYKTKKERNQDISSLEGKYLTIYNDYEESTKTQVDSIISNVQKEVIAKDLNHNISDEYFELYRIQKEKRIEKMVSELKKLS